MHPCLIRDHAHPGGFPGLVLPGPVIFGRDAGRTVTDDFLSGHEIILVDQIADVGPTEIMPAEMLEAGLQPALLQDLDQRIGGQVSLFPGDDPFGAGEFAGPGDVAEECSGCATSQEQPFVQILR